MGINMSSGSESQWSRLGCRYVSRVMQERTKRGRGVIGKGKSEGKEEEQNKLEASLDSTLIDILIRNQISLPWNYRHRMWKWMKELERKSDEVAGLINSRHGALSLSF